MGNKFKNSAISMPRKFLEFFIAQKCDSRTKKTFVSNLYFFGHCVLLERMLELVFLFLLKYFHEWVSVLHVCKDWYKIGSKMCITNRVTLSYIPHVSNVPFERIKRGKFRIPDGLSNDQFSNTLSDFLHTVPLRYLSIAGKSVTGFHFNFLNTLNVLKLVDVWMPDDRFQPIIHMKNLQKIVLKNISFLWGKKLNIIGQSKYIKTLKIDTCGLYPCTLYFDNIETLIMKNSLSADIAEKSIMCPNLTRLKIIDTRFDLVVDPTITNSADVYPVIHVNMFNAPQVQQLVILSSLYTKQLFKNIFVFWPQLTQLNVQQAHMSSKLIQSLERLTKTTPAIAYVGSHMAVHYKSLRI